MKLRLKSDVVKSTRSDVSSIFMICRVFILHLYMLYIPPPHLKLLYLLFRVVLIGEESPGEPPPAHPLLILTPGIIFSKVRQKKDL